MRRNANLGRHEVLFSTVCLLLILTVPVRTQHSRDPATGGGKAEIVLPVSGSINSGSVRARGTVKQTLQLITKTDEGWWYYLPRNTRLPVRRGKAVRFAVAFIPLDLAAERRAGFNRYLKSDPEKADNYLAYVATLYGAEMLCDQAKYRFVESMDVSAKDLIGEEPPPTGWTEWKAVSGSAWARVRRLICN